MKAKLLGNNIYIFRFVWSLKSFDIICRSSVCVWFPATFLSSDKQTFSHLAVSWFQSSLIGINRNVVVKTVSFPSISTERETIRVSGESLWAVFPPRGSERGCRPCCLPAARRMELIWSLRIPSSSSLRRPFHFQLRLCSGSHKLILTAIMNIVFHPSGRELANNEVLTESSVPRIT